MQFRIVLLCDCPQRCKPMQRHSAKRAESGICRSLFFGHVQDSEVHTGIIPMSLKDDFHNCALSPYLHCPDIWNSLYPSQLPASKNWSWQLCQRSWDVWVRQQALDTPNTQANLTLASLQGHFLPDLKVASMRRLTQIMGHFFLCTGNTNKLITKLILLIPLWVNIDQVQSCTENTNRAVQPGSPGSTLDPLQMGLLHRTISLALGSRGRSS